jgi:hypothetical protein
MILVTTLKEESILMNALIKLMMLFMCHKFPSCMIQMFILFNFLLVIAATMKEFIKYYLYASSNDMMCSHINDMQCYTSTCCYLVIYKMPMHRKKVRLCCYCFHILWCSIPCFSLTIILMITPWNPGIMYGALSKGEGECSKIQVPS